MHNDINLSIKIYVNNLENIVTFKIKKGYYLKRFTLETKLFQSNKSKITKNKKGENLSHLDITEAGLIHCNIINSDYHNDSRALLLIRHLLNY